MCLKEIWEKQMKLLLVLRPAPRQSMNCNVNNLPPEGKNQLRTKNCHT